MFPVCKISRTSDVYDYFVIHPKSCWSLLSPSGSWMCGQEPHSAHLQQLHCSEGGVSSWGAEPGKTKTLGGREKKKRARKEEKAIF